MNPALWIGKTGLDAQQTRLAVISNNLANVSTTGFKKGRAAFEDLLYQNVRQPGAYSSQNTQLPSGLMLGVGSRVVSTEKLFQQGPIVQTHNSLDVALQGNGFIQVLLPDGTIGYSRDGSFELNSQGQIVNHNGFLIQPGITIPPNAQSVTVGKDGTVSVTLPGQNAAPQQLGQFELADFINPGGLQPIGENLFLETLSSGAPQVGAPGTNGLATMTQGFVESSNVNVVEELVNMIEAQRAYEMNAKSISTADNMLQYASTNL